MAFRLARTGSRAARRAMLAQTRRDGTAEDHDGRLVWRKATGDVSSQAGGALTRGLESFNPLGISVIRR